MPSAWKVLLAVAWLPVAGCGSVAPPPDDQVGLTVVQLHGADPPEIRTVRVPRPRVRADGVLESAITQDPSCAGASLWLYDAPVGQPYRNEVCVSGTGSLSLAALARGSCRTPLARACPNWAGAVQSYFGGINLGMLWSAACSTVSCPVQRMGVFEHANNSSDPQADGVTLYALTPVPSSSSGLHQFIVSDRNLGAFPSGLPVDFVWSGDTYTAQWNAQNQTQHGLVGHYIGMNTLGNEDVVRCNTDDDCTFGGAPKLSGYQCKPYGSAWYVPAATFNPYRSAYRFVEPSTNPPSALGGTPENNCYQASASQCSSDDDCTVQYTDVYPPGGTPHSLALPGKCSAQNQCVLSKAQGRTAEFKYWRARHPEWILYREDARSGANPGPYQENVAWFDDSPQVPLDFTNPAVVAELLSRVRYWEALPDGTQAHYDALSLDVVYPENHFSAKYIFPVNSPTVPSQLFAGISGTIPCGPNPNFTCYPDPAYTQGVLNLLRRLHDEVNKDGLRLFANIGFPGSAYDSDYVLQGVFSYVDGILDEGGFTQIQSWGSFASGQFWLNLLSNIRWAQQLGKSFYSKNTFGNLTGLPDWQSVEYALASHLLARLFPAPAGASESIYVSGLPDNAEVVPLPAQTAALTPNLFQYSSTGGFWPPIIDDIGAPCEDIQNPLVGVYTRRFSHAFVAVNSTDNPTAAPALPAGAHTFFEWNGSDGYSSPVGSLQPLPRQRGIVLYTAPNDFLCGS